ncbi:MAG: NAD(P)-dependent oxidoreductase [Deltaproteobacteria bacterium]|nr:NAD(P)-dependent oxidoreductase [Deltaproteobacteria bacterium]
MKVVVVGATGFIGSALVAQLRAAGDSVVELSLRDPQTPARARDEGADVVFHLGWCARGDYLSSVDNFDCLAQSTDLVRALRPGQRIVVAGTCYEQPWAPKTAYGTCKGALREVALGLALDVFWARIHFLYGPREGPNRLVPKIIKALLAGETMALSAGTQVRDYLHVDDVAAGLRAPLSGTRDVGAGVGVTVRTIAEEIAAVVGRPDLLQFGAPADEPPIVIADATALRASGWAPRWSLRAGLADTVAWWLKQGDR